MIPTNRLNYNRQPKAKPDQDRPKRRSVPRSNLPRPTRQLRDEAIRKRAQETDRYYSQLAADNESQS